MKEYGSAINQTISDSMESLPGMSFTERRNKPKQLEAPGKTENRIRTWDASTLPEEAAALIWRQWLLCKVLKEKMYK